jgi:PilZ domain
VLARKRAERFAIQVPVRYRTTGETQWHDGITVNVSASGAEIVGELPESAGASGASVLVVILLPPAAGCLTGRGRVVRTTTPCVSAAAPHFAITVPRYELERGPAALARIAPLLQEC